MTTREELNSQLAQIHHEIGKARRAGDYAQVNMLERIAPRFEIELGPLCRCPDCLKVEERILPLLQIAAGAVPRA